MANEKKFEHLATVPGCLNWEQLTKREDDLYHRVDDIRSPFARDYTRVLHSLAYRRLKHKTQVFFNAAGNDHICTRIEHVQHVESVSNTICKELGLNEELTKAIALAHDLGHAPFGHQGEKILKSLTKKYLEKDFWHEQNGVYFVDNIEMLEDNQKVYRNLNLTYAVRDGIISHCGEVDQNSIKPREDLFDLSQFDEAGKYQAATWEGCIVKIADKIAYIGRDIEDAVRLGFLEGEPLKQLQKMAKVHNQAALNTTVIMHNMIIDLCQNSTPEKGLTLSTVMCEQLDTIKEFNYKYIYLNKRLEPSRKYSELIIHEIFKYLLEYYEIYGRDVIFCLEKNRFGNKDFVRDFTEWLVQYSNLDFSKSEWAKNIADRCMNRKIYGDLSDEKLYIQAIIDFIAGMTDIYAVHAFEELLNG